MSPLPRLPTPINPFYEPVPDTANQYQVHGKRASSYEWNVAQAADLYDVPFIFQVEYLGGRRMRGGFILDFLFLTNPFSTPVWVNGDYWHRDSSRAFLQLASLPADIRDTLALPIILWGADCDTEEAARRSFQEKIL